MQFDLLIRNGVVVDGTGAPRRHADVGISGARIQAVGNLADARGTRELDAQGLIVAPGFIDCHAHDDRLLLSDPDMTPKLSQGVTTVVTGNCGISLAPMPGPVPEPVTPPLDLLDRDGPWFRFPTFADYVAQLDAQPAAINFAPLVGHTTLRVAVMEDVLAPASEAEMQAMRTLASQALQAGAIGISTGLAYTTASAATTREVLEVCQPLREFNGIYCTHMRDEADGSLDSLAETFDIGRELGVPVVVSHHKLIGTRNFGRSTETLAYIERNMRLQPICLDCYPYSAGSTVLEVWRAQRCERVIVTWSAPHPEYAGRDLRDIAEAMGVSRDEAVERLMPGGAIYFLMDENDVSRILGFAPTMVGSDGLPHDSRPHPRLWGAFPRVLGHYVREQGLFALETAVHKMTGLTAGNFGLADRGVLRAGAWADVTLFDADTVGETGDFSSEPGPARGIAHVLVNGRLAWTEGRSTGSRGGQRLRRCAAAPAA